MKDDYDIPGRVIPSGFIYQWADKEFLPLCLENEWTKVPFIRHADLFDKSCEQPDGSIKVHLSTLIEKASEGVRVTRLKEIRAVIENEVKAAEKWNDGLTKARVTTEVNSHMNRLYSQIHGRKF